MQNENLPPTCEIRDWPVFVDGFHKGQLYPDEDLQRMEGNFQRLSSENAEFKAPDGSPFLVAKAKIGHDKQQRAKKSLGFTNVGRIKALRRGQDGTVRLWLDNVPTEVGAKVNAGLLDGGSIEVIPELPNPRAPAEKIRGPIITGVALLGDEQPAIKGMGRPRAVFPDGTPVPPDYKVERWLNAFAEAASKPDAAPEEAREFAAFAEKFAMPNAPNDQAQRRAAIERLRSFGYPVDDPEMLTLPTERLVAMADDKERMSFSSKFSTFSDFSSKFGAACKMYGEGAKEEDIEKAHPGFSAAFSDCKKMFGGDMPPPPGGGAGGAAPPPAAPAAPIASPAPAATMGDMTPEKMAAMFADMENLKTKLSALEAAESDRQQKSSSEMSAHFSAEAAKVFAKPTCKNRLPIKCPKTGIPLRANVIGMFTPAAAQFSAADAATTVQKQLTALEEYVAQLPESIAFSEQVDDRGEPANGTSLTPYQREVLGSETMWKHIGPAVLNKILEPATK